MHIHPFGDSRVALDTKSALVIESGLANFSSEKDSLTFPFQAIHDNLKAEHTHVIVELPAGDMVKGAGKGYILDLKEYLLSERPEWKVDLLVFDMSTFGAPVCGQRLVLVASEQRVVIKNGPVTALADKLPSVCYHAPGIVRRPLLHGGMAAAYGYLNSHQHPLGEIAKWGNQYPVVEKREGDSLKVARLTEAEMQILWGVHPVEGVTTLSRCTPASCLQFILAQKFCN